MSDAEPRDLILLGGGLANALIAWWLAEARPEVRWEILEAGAALGGNHTWSFHASDVTDAQRARLAPLVAHRWEAQEVRFPGLARTLPSPYASLTSAGLHAALAARFPDRIRLNCAAERIDARQARLPDGCVLQASAVIDGRGFLPSPHLSLAYQKFLGLEVTLRAPHGLTRPILMDATVEQIDGFRFLYTLPLDAARLLVEDTYYSDTPDLDLPALRRRVADYAAAQGWQIAAIIREETGVLGVVLDGSIAEFWEEPVREFPVSGLRAGLLHATTGYSLPEAVRLAERLAALPNFAAETVQSAIRDHASARWRGQRFFRLLNRLLFFASPPELRYKVLRHFYRLPTPLIERFYASRLHPLDGARILSGRPPVPVMAALRVLISSCLRKFPHA